MPLSVFAKPKKEIQPEPVKQQLQTPEKVENALPGPSPSPNNPTKMNPTANPADKKQSLKQESAEPKSKTHTAPAFSISKKRLMRRSRSNVSSIDKAEDEDENDSESLSNTKLSLGLKVKPQLLNLQGPLVAGTSGDLQVEQLHEVELGDIHGNGNRVADSTVRSTPSLRRLKNLTGKEGARYNNALRVS